MYRFFLCFLMIILVVNFNFKINAMAKFESAQEEKILVIHSNGEKQDHTQIRILDALLGQFSNDITILEDSNLNQGAGDQFEYLFYFGEDKKELSHKVINFIDNFNGRVFAIGKNIEQLSRFSHLDVLGEVVIEFIILSGNSTREKLPEERIVNKIYVKSPGKIIMSGTTKNKEQIPLLIVNKDTFYLANESLFDPIGYKLTDTLFDFFNEKKPKDNVKYIRLEDVHPMTDSENLRKIAEILKDMQIPYMVTVIPVYTNKGETLHLSDSPELVKTLKYMQDNGGSIVLHGYRHQYRDSETGEGFEFWDVQNDRPIYQSSNEKVLKEDDFSSRQYFQKFIAEEGVEFEKKYIRSAIEQGVQELVAHKLYPLAFEAPHYAMSQNGYRILSKHFSTYIGQVQLTDSSWESVYTTLYPSKPSFLRGMQLLPETVGYVRDGDENAIKKIKERALEIKKYPGAYISGFYHPYLGYEKLNDLISAIDTISNNHWLDLKDINNSVSVEGVSITSSNGKIKVSKDFLTGDYEKHILIKKVVLVLTVLIVMVLLVLVLLLKRKNKIKSKSSAL